MRAKPQAKVTAFPIAFAVALLKNKLTYRAQVGFTYLRDPIMPIRVKCENCKKTLSVKDHLAGKKIKCPVCQSVVLVSASAPPAKESAAPTDPSNPAAGKPATATKPKTAKPTTDKPATNGTPANGHAKGNGVPTKPAEPAAPPPESIEAEALAAFADEPKPEVDDGPPQTIDFTCVYCDAELHLAVDMAGKQIPCPNEECKRIIKVPLPKVTEKKDWRKMDRRGPAAALINQQEQLEDAWGTEEATKARQASLLEAGAIEQPKKPGIGVYGWIGRGIYAVIALAILGVVGVVGSRMLETNETFNAVKEVTLLVEGDKTQPPKIVDPVLQAEGYRTIAELHLHAKQGKALTARDKFFGARAMATPIAGDSSIHKQMFLIDLALAQIELAGSEDDAIAKDKLRLKDAYEEIIQTLTVKTIHPETQMIAVREVATRLLELNQPEMANNLAGRLGNADQTGKRPLIAAQQIALLKMKDDKTMLAGFGKTPDPEKEKGKDYFDATLRVGYAEGYARLGNYAEALALVQMRGPAKDRLEAALGVAAVALTTKKNKAEASKFVKEAIAIAKGPPAPSPWQRLQLIRLAARTDDETAAKEMINTLPPPFKVRAQLEMFIAHCENATGPVAADALPEINAADDKEGVTLALAWLHMARHNASKGAERKQNRAAFELYLKITPPTNPEMLRPMVDVGTYQGRK